MMYQWGRKDPFTPSTATASATTPGGEDTQLYNAAGAPINNNTYGIGGEWTHYATALNVTQVATLINYPSTYYTGGNVPIASTGTLSNDWWNPTAKTLYDPCPAGYRVPPYGTFNGFSTLPNNGIAAGVTWNTSFFPASGLRTYSKGQFIAVGNHGYNWMSTPVDVVNGYYLHFNSGAVLPNGIYPRAAGKPVRCISE